MIVINFDSSDQCLFGENHGNKKDTDLINQYNYVYIANRNKLGTVRVNQPEHKNLKRTFSNLHVYTQKVQCKYQLLKTYKLACALLNCSFQ